VVVFLALGADSVVFVVSGAQRLTSQLLLCSAVIQISGKVGQSSGIEPWVLQSFVNCHSLFLVFNEQFLDEVLGVRRDPLPDLVVEVVVGLIDELECFVVVLASKR